MSRKRSEGGILALVYIRYLLPIIMCAALIGVMFIPCLSYSTVEGTQSEISAAELVENSWDQVRSYLFATSEREITQERFSWTVLILLPVLVLLFIVGSLSALAVAACALAYVSNWQFRKTEVGIWFITIIPNRIVACALHACVLPLMFYSRIIIPLYDKIMHVDVLLNVSFPEPWVWGLIAIALTVALSVISSYFEKKYDIDPFKKRVPPAVRVIDPEGDESDDSEYVPKNEAERIYYEQQKKSREEQAELIRRLLSKNDEKEK